MFETEDPYGLKKRYEFAVDLIKRKSVTNVLEVGCGTGALLLRPLAAQCPECRFSGVDSDQASIDYASMHFEDHNLHFFTRVEEQEKHDMVIASEVLEHVDQPLQFLLSLREYLSPGGIVLLTIPNGYGAFEGMSALQIILQNSGVLPRVQRLKRKLLGQSNTAQLNDTYLPMTLAASPHVNFFRFGEIQRLIAAAGYEIELQRNRTWLCGFPVDMLIGRLNLSDWNANIADHLPPAFVSDWMFVLKAGAKVAGGEEYQAGYWARFRRWLNRKTIIVAKSVSA